MDDPVKDRLRDGTVFVFCAVTVYPKVPFIRIILRAQDQGAFPAASFNDFQKVVFLRLRKRP